MGRNSILLSVIFSFALIGCGKTVVTPLDGDPGEPIVEVKSTKYCAPDEEGNYQSVPEPIEEKGFDGENFFAVGGGCIFRPVREVWAVSHSEAALKWNDARSKGFQRLPHEEVPFLFASTYEAGPSIFAQKWSINWYHTIVEGDQEEPESVIVRYQKEWGTSHIRYWGGNIELKRLTDDVTGFAMFNKINGTRIGEENAAGGIRDILSNLREKAPDWGYLGEPE